MADLVAGRPIEPKTQPVTHTYGILATIPKFRGWEKSDKALADIRIVRSSSAAETLALAMRGDQDFARVDTHEWTESMN